MNGPILQPIPAKSVAHPICFKPYSRGDFLHHSSENRDGWRITFYSEAPLMAPPCATDFAAIQSYINLPWGNPCATDFAAMQSYINLPWGNLCATDFAAIQSYINLPWGNLCATDFADAKPLFAAIQSYLNRFLRKFCRE